ncbi:MAG: hypothetical protein IRD7MM_05995 [Candidatus Midichloria mitochondrii]
MEGLEIIIISSLAGELPEESGLVDRRPFFLEKPHSSASMAAMGVRVVEKMLSQEKLL